MTRLRSALFVALLLAPDCTRRPVTDTPAPRPEESAPVPAPIGLVASATLRSPDALWGKVKDAVAGPLAHLPRSFAEAAANTAKLDPALAGEVDGAAAAYAAASLPGKTLGWTLAFKLRDAPHARAALLGGKSPRYAARPADGGLTVLTLAASPPPPGVDPVAPTLVALSPLGFLLAAGSEADLVTLAPYVTRTLPARPLSAHALSLSIAHDALAGPMRNQLLEQVAFYRSVLASMDRSLRQAHGGKAPDLGDPDTVIDALDRGARGLIDSIADLPGAEFGVDGMGEEIDVEATFPPGTGPSKDAIAALRTGTAAPLLTLSADTGAALLVVSDAPSRAESARAAEEQLLTAFKPTLRPADTASVHAAVESWATARGGWLTLATEDGGAVALRFPADDPALATKAVEKLVGLSEVPTFRTILAKRFSVSSVSTASAEVPGVGTASIASFRGGAQAERELALAWSASGGVVHAAGATSAAKALQATRDSTGLLGSDAPLAAKLGALQDRSSLALVLRPRLGATTGPRASVVLGIGRSGTNGWARLAVDDAVLSDTLRRWFDD